MRTKPYATSVLIFDEVELLDVTGPISVLTAAGRQWNFQPFKIELVAAELGPVATRSGLALQPTRTFATPGDVECLIIPGKLHGGAQGGPGASGGGLGSVARRASAAQFVLAIGNWRGSSWPHAQACSRTPKSRACRELADEDAQYGPRRARVNVDSSVCESGQLLSTCTQRARPRFPRCPVSSSAPHRSARSSRPQPRARSAWAGRASSKCSRSSGFKRAGGHPEITPPAGHAVRFESASRLSWAAHFQKIADLSGH